MSSWLGHATTSYHHPAKTINLPTKSGSKIPLSDLCKSSIPACLLNPLLFNGHLQTAWTVMKEDGPAVHYKRKIFEQDDPIYNGSFAVDFVSHSTSEKTDESLPPRTTYFSEEEWAQLPSDDSRPMLVTLHGLSGGSHEVYLRHVLAPMVVKESGWEACVVNSRGCANSKITSSVLYNARATWDVRQMVKWLRKTFPNRPLYGVGFSLGACIMTNYVGEEGSNCVLKAAVVVSNPWNLDVSSHALQRSWIGLNVYSKSMGASMKKLFEQHIDEIRKIETIDMDEVRKIRYLHEFDRAVQCPTWGYPTEGAYYRDASSIDSLLAVRIPFLAINAEDDPIAHREAIPWMEAKKNPCAVMCTTSLGGHLSWFEFGGGRWFAKAVTGFFKKFVHEIDLERLDEAQADVEFSTAVEELAFNPVRRKMHVAQ